MADASCARMISAFAPRPIRLSTSDNCLAVELCASVLMYFTPAASSAFLMAASSVFQRSSWKFDQLTPTIKSAALTADAATTPPKVRPATETAVRILRKLIVRYSLECCAEIDRPRSYHAISYILYYEIYSCLLQSHESRFVEIEDRNSHNTHRKGRYERNFSNSTARLISTNRIKYSL